MKITTNIETKDINILKFLFGKTLTKISYKDDSKFSESIILHIENNSFTVFNYENPNDISEDYAEDIRIIKIVEGAVRETTNDVKIDKIITSIKIIKTEIENNEDDAPSLTNQNGIVIEFSDKTFVIIHCIQSISCYLDVYFSITDFESSVKLEKEFLETTVYLDENNIKSKIIRKYIDLK